MKEKHLMNSINETYERAKEENLGVSKGLIRKAVLHGTIPSVKMGNKSLVSWDAFVQFLQTGGVVQATEPKEATAAGIRAVPVNLRPVGERGTMKARRP